MRVRRSLLGATLGLAMLGAAAPAAHAGLSWAPPSHDFGSQEVGVSSAPMTFTLTATCDAGMGACTTPIHTYGSVSAPGVDFNLDSTTCTLGTLVTPLDVSTDSCTARVAFKPSSLGPKSGVLATASGPSVALSGNGVESVDGKDGAGKKCKKKKKKGKSSASAAKKKKKSCKKKKKKK
jgi:hypothetical protein